jgi:phytanoyl-CoA hydroxylase
MLSWLRRIKLFYSVYNFFHRKELLQNERLLKKLGLRKRYYSSLSSKDFKGLPGSKPDDHVLDKQRLSSCKLFAHTSTLNRQSLLAFDDNGYAVLDKYLSLEQVDAVNAEVNLLLKERKVKFTNGNKIMFAIHASPLLKSIGEDENLKELLSVLIGGKALLFQSINFITGSEQATHSDSIHMTTYPLGGLLGVWIALDDVTDDNGPLHYYPGSQKLPYYLNADYDNEGNAFLLGGKSYAQYEKMIAEKIQERGLPKQTFYAKKGDLLIWHANLFHGGDPHRDKSKTRRSMVLHYFKENAICYHEISQRPALLKNFD